jgi:hypothetical protein
LPPQGLRVSEVTSDSCLISWLLPNGHLWLSGFKIHVQMSDGNFFSDVVVTKTTSYFNVQYLQPGHDYEISAIALCLSNGNLRRTESEVSLVHVTTWPEKVQNLRLDYSLPNTLSVMWDTPLVAMNLRYSRETRNTRPAPVSLLLCDNLKNRMFLQNFFS